MTLFFNSFSHSEIQANLSSPFSKLPGVRLNRALIRPLLDSSFLIKLISYFNGK